MPPPRLLALGLRCAPCRSDPLPPVAAACSVWLPSLAVSRSAHQNIAEGRGRKARSSLHSRGAPRDKSPSTCRQMLRACGRCSEWTPTGRPGSAAAASSPAPLWLDERRSKRLGERLSKRRAASAARREETLVWRTRAAADLNTERGSARRHRSQVPCSSPSALPGFRRSARPPFFFFHLHPRQSR